MTRAADDFAFIKARQDEIARETQERIAGQPLPIDLPDPVPEEKPVYGMYGELLATQMTMAELAEIYPRTEQAFAFLRGKDWTPEQRAGIMHMSAYAQAVKSYMTQRAQGQAEGGVKLYGAANAYQAPDSDPA